MNKYLVTIDQDDIDDIDEPTLAQMRKIEEGFGFDLD